MSTRKTGYQAENFAKQVLQRQGLVVTEMNYYTPYGEIDLIALDGDCIAFVEVKARKAGSFGAPAEAVNAQKQSRIVKSAVVYLTKHPVDLQPRFDVFEVVLEKGEPFSVQSYDYIINAYEVENYESI